MNVFVATNETYLLTATSTCTVANHILFQDTEVNSITLLNIEFIQSAPK